jgi:hypothetical protein
MEDIPQDVFEHHILPHLSNKDIAILKGVSQRLKSKSETALHNKKVAIIKDLVEKFMLFDQFQITGWRTVLGQIVGYNKTNEIAKYVGNKLGETKDEVGKKKVLGDAFDLFLTMKQVRDLSELEVMRDAYSIINKYQGYRNVG